MTTAIQDQYSDHLSHCYGCGQSNPAGLHLKSYLDGSQTVASFTPSPVQSGGVPDHVYGGLIASLMDCHGTASAAAFLQANSPAEARLTISEARCVTASLSVNFLRPTPMGEQLLLTGRLKEVQGRKVWIDLALSARDEICATGEMLAIRFAP